ncbi:MAG: PKD domain-containing protein, partial [Planctomycetota bacterium]
GDFVVSVDLEFQIPDSQPVGRHAGVMFCMDGVGPRSEQSGYLVWYIDRETDRGLNLFRRDAGAFTPVASGTFGLDQGPPSNIRIESIGPEIIVYADDAEVIRVEDSTYRSGYYGLWTWDGANQEVRFDNYFVEVEPVLVAPCFTSSPASAAEGEDIQFDASCTEVFEGKVASYEWDFGDGATAEGEVASHAYEFADNYVVTLTVEDDSGNRESLDRVISISEQCLPFDDDFERGEGPVDAWTAFSGEWNIDETGSLQTSPTSEAHVWAGDPPCLMGGDMTIEFEVDVRATPADAVGRHFSVFFYAEEPISRWETRGYSVWWIDRPQDFGVALHAWNFGQITQLGPTSRDTAPDLVDPPRLWTITIEGPRITVYGDCRRILEFEDESVPRNGHFGFWSYLNGQDVAFDNVSVRRGVFAPDCGELFVCASYEPTPAKAGEDLTFDASCSQVPQGVDVTYRWDFGDGSTGEGETVEHTYEFSGNYVVELTGTPSIGDPKSTQLEVSVSEPPPEEICIDFDDAEPGAVSGWTTFGGNWEITEGGQLRGTSGGAEANGEGHIWFGDPPVVFSGDFALEFDIEFLNHVGDQAGAVGKHAGAFFFASDPISRWNLQGYDVFWIDRTQDFGLSLHRWPLQFLSPGTGIEFPELDLNDPPLRWRIETVGETIRVFGDGELLIERNDNTRREGHIGFWVYSNDQEILIDNVSISQGGGSACDETSVRPCFRSSGAQILAGDATQFDASCTVVSQDVDVTSYSWNFGDGESGTGEIVDHVFDEAGSYDVVLTIEHDGPDSPAVTSRSVTVSAVLELPHSETFDVDGDVLGWTVSEGTWSVVDGALEIATEPTQEATIWLGDPPLVVDGNVTFEFDIEFLAHTPVPDDAVGRHAGVLFCAEAPTTRFGSPSLYDTWWIDRSVDYGVGSHYWSGGGIADSTPGTGFDLDDPPQRWRIVVRDDVISVFGDDAFLYDFPNTERRSGYLGFWAYFNGQRVRIDNLCITEGEIDDGELDCDGPPPPPEGVFQRGDGDANGQTNITDAIYLLGFLFLGGPPPPCADAGDVDDSGVINITDGIALLGYLFLGGDQPPAPFGDCGIDPTEDVTECADFPPCS